MKNLYYIQFVGAELSDFILESAGKRDIYKNDFGK
jgi:hypothetical protein